MYGTMWLSYCMPGPSRQVNCQQRCQMTERGQAYPEYRVSTFGGFSLERLIPPSTSLDLMAQ